MNADFKFSANQSANVYGFAASYVGKQPKNFYIDLAIGYNETLGGVSHPLIPSLSVSCH